MPRARSVVCSGVGLHADIKSWFQRAAPKLAFDGATDADLQRLEKTIDTELPLALAFMLREANGSMWFMEKEGMSCAAIAEVVGKLEGQRSWRAGIVPFAGDEGMGLLVVDTRDKGAAVYEWDEDDGVSSDPVAPSLAQYLEMYRNQLLAGHCEYLDDAGVVEKGGGGGQSRK